MLGKNTKQIEAAYAKSKQMYNDLLEKNQNDLIKIRIREKTLNDKIITIQREREQEVNKLKTEIQELREKLKGKQTLKTTLELNSAPIKHDQNQLLALKGIMNQKDKQITQLRKLLQTKIQDENKILKIDTKNEQDIKFLKKQIADYKRKQQKIIKFVLKQSEVINGLENTITNVKQKDKQKNEKQSINLLLQLKQMTQRYTKIIKEQTEKKESIVIKSQQERSNNSNLINLLKERLQSTNQELKRLLQKSNKLDIANKVKEQEIQKLNKQLQKSTEKQQDNNIKSQCAKCLQLQQQIQLHKQMLKSVRMMLKLKQMELQKLKK